MNDVVTLSRSKLLERLKDIISMEEIILYLYGDSLYSNRFSILAPFKHHGGHRWLNLRQTALNRKMSSYRIAVEHLFGL